MVNRIALGTWPSPGLGARLRAYAVLATITVLAAVTVFGLRVHVEQAGAAAGVPSGAQDR
jgi:hypothetical protein